MKNKRVIFFNSYCIIPINPQRVILFVMIAVSHPRTWGNFGKMNPKGMS